MERKVALSLKSLEKLESANHYLWHGNVARRGSQRHKAGRRHAVVEEMRMKLLAMQLNAGNVALAEAGGKPNCFEGSKAKSRFDVSRQLKAKLQEATSAEGASKEELLDIPMEWLQ
jgi:hypothetical protein